MMKNQLIFIIKKFFTGALISVVSIILFCFIILGKSSNKNIININDKINHIKPVNNMTHPLRIKVYMTKQCKIKEMDLEEYVKGVVASEMPAEFSLEALKAQAVAARTYALAHMKEYGGSSCPKAKNANLCDTIHCQVFKYKEERMKSWPKLKKYKYWAKIERAVDETKMEVITYDDEVIKEPYYFSTSSGNTENSVEVFANEVPYLKSVKSPEDKISPKFKTKVVYSEKELFNIINKSYPNSLRSNKRLKNQLSIESRTKAGSVKILRMGRTKISGIKFRSLLGLNSSNFTFNFKGNNVEIFCRGYGHGVGMSQWGANALAKKGENYKNILKHYYTGIKINNYEEIALQ